MKNLISLIFRREKSEFGKFIDQCKEKQDKKGEEDGGYSLSDFIRDFRAIEKDRYVKRFIRKTNYSTPEERKRIIDAHLSDENAFGPMLRNFNLSYGEMDRMTEERLREDHSIPTGIYIDIQEEDPDTKEKIGKCELRLEERGFYLEHRFFLGEEKINADPKVIFKSCKYRGDVEGFEIKTKDLIPQIKEAIKRSIEYDIKNNKI